MCPQYNCNDIKKRKYISCEKHWDCMHLCNLYSVHLSFPFQALVGTILIHLKIDHPYTHTHNYRSRVYLNAVVLSRQAWFLISFPFSVKSTDICSIKCHFTCGEMKWNFILSCKITIVKCNWKWPITYLNIREKIFIPVELEACKFWNGAYLRLKHSIPSVKVCTMLLL